MEWACTVKKEYYDAMIEGRKRLEVRTRVPCIRLGDMLFVCCGNEIIQCKVCSVLKMDVERAWYLYADKMCIDERKYYSYLQGKDVVFLIGLWVVEKLTDEKRKVFRSVVPKNPQWFSKVKF